MTAETAKKLKERGNAKFKSGEFAEARQEYTKALATLKNSEERSEGNADVERAVLLKNRSAAYLKLRWFELAEQDAYEAMKILGGDAKSVYRRAQARYGMGDFAGALADTETATKLAPNDKAVLELTQKSESLQLSIEANGAAEVWSYEKMDVLQLPVNILRKILGSFSVDEVVELAGVCRQLQTSIYEAGLFPWKKRGLFIKSLKDADTLARLPKMAHLINSVTINTCSHMKENEFISTEDIQEGIIIFPEFAAADTLSVVVSDSMDAGNLAALGSRFPAVVKLTVNVFFSQSIWHAMFPPIAQAFPKLETLIIIIFSPPRDIMLTQGDVVCVGQMLRGLPNLVHLQLRTLFHPSSQMSLGKCIGVHCPNLRSLDLAISSCMPGSVRRCRTKFMLKCELLEKVAICLNLVALCEMEVLAQLQYLKHLHVVGTPRLPAENLAEFFNAGNLSKITHLLLVSINPEEFGYTDELLCSIVCGMPHLLSLGIKDYVHIGSSGPALTFQGIEQLLRHPTLQAVALRFDFIGQTASDYSDYRILSNFPTSACIGGQFLGALQPEGRDMGNPPWESLEFYGTLCFASAKEI